ncbi:unnamed protein product [Adineta ricciae]|uniref:Uncharacterized protein n=1 Tax=Adineta ricciae TaxID=249248 RepID=A0A813XLR9_ADIRI|nr:unnamed protein product [Adineta ricciae]
MSLIRAFNKLSLILPTPTDAYILNEVSMHSYINKYVDDPIFTSSDMIDKTMLDSQCEKEKSRKINRICHCASQRSTKIIKHGLSYINKPFVISSTVRTGHCSKLPKSNELVRKSKNKQRLLRQQLQEQVQALESKQDYLLLQVQDLNSYKYQLEVKCQENNSICRSSF